MNRFDSTYKLICSFRKSEAFGAYTHIHEFSHLRYVFLRNNIVPILFILLISLTSCGNKTAEDIENELSSGVVLIQNKSYYEAKLSNGESLYFTEFDKDDGIIGLTADVDSVDKAVSYGTGFFISSDGKIATNHHVVADKVENQEITKSISNLIDALKSALSDEYDEVYKKYEVANNLTEMALYDDDFTASDYREIRSYRDELDSELEIYKQIYSNLSSLRPENSDIIYHNELSIGYNDTYVTKDSDLSSCVIRKTNKDKDLAIIQLKDKKTPSDKYVFSIADSDPLEEYDMLEKLGKTFNQDKNSQIYMPAYNLGPSLSITEDGLRLQFSSGSISRRSSDEIMYTIPSLPGSSGSPIVNRKGEVVAINTSGVRGSDSFNSGVRVKHLNKLIVDL